MAVFRPATVLYSAVLLSLLYLLFTTQPWARQRTLVSTARKHGGHRPAFYAPHANIWHELSPEEADSVNTLLSVYLSVENGPGLNASASKIQWLEAIRPNKTDVVSHLTSGAPEPRRWAKALIQQSINGTTWLNYYAIGPLPVDSTTTVEPLKWPFKDGRYGVKTPVTSFESLQSHVMEFARNISDIAVALLDGSPVTIKPDDPNSLRLNARSAFMDDGKLVLWCGAMRAGAHSSAWSVLPQGLYIKLEIDPGVSDSYRVLQFYYNGIFYETADDLRLAMKQPGFRKSLPNYDGDWTHTEDLSENEERAIPPPVMVQPHGPRYKIDRDQQYISYMGWTFYFTSFLSTGPALYDIRFRNTSVLYELTLNEAMAHYAGSDPIQGAQMFLDTAFGMGKFAFELVPGYDCPAYADYISTDYHIRGKTWTNKNSMCIFEYTSDALLQRHTSQYQVTVSRNTYLVLRYVSTVGNYDYTFDYIFYLDGTLEVKVRASGFIFAAFYNNVTSSPEPPNRDFYGYRIHNATSSSMHDHVLLFRADPDVVSRNNTLARLQIRSTAKSYPWDTTTSRNTMTLSRRPVSKESGLDWPPNSREMYLVESAERNAWGERRAYRIAPGTGMGTPGHLTVRHSSVLGSRGKWAERDLWVVRQRDEERGLADPVDWFDGTGRGLVDFDRVVRGEGIVAGNAGVKDDGYHGDLMVYFNLGGHHVPTSGDLPNTLMHTSASSVMFVPHNFHDQDPSRRTSQGVRMGLKGGNGAGWLKQHGGQYEAETEGGGGGGGGVDSLEYFGGRYEEGWEAGKEELEPDLRMYGGGKEDADLTLMGALGRD
ncbi:Copper amine oxidase 1 [Sphaceloma murrayae]|uniref:Amine oxidase n=1 Tax=Sphaceloma murrayae TaxID=2082308 RepID=A0A2K1QQ85_9PEZI|nr:Copper amine oxidase 1 [Sphaceloma murrayae]